MFSQFRIIFLHRNRLVLTFKWVVCPALESHSVWRSPEIGRQRVALFLRIRNTQIKSPRILLVVFKRWRIRAQRKSTNSWDASWVNDFQRREETAHVLLTALRQVGLVVYWSDVRMSRSSIEIKLLMFRPWGFKMNWDVATRPIARLCARTCSDILDTPRIVTSRKHVTWGERLCEVSFRRKVQGVRMFEATVKGNYVADLSRELPNDRLNSTCIPLPLRWAFSTRLR